MLLSPQTRSIEMLAGRSAASGELLTNLAGRGGPPWTRVFEDAARRSMEAARSPS